MTMEKNSYNYLKTLVFLMISMVLIGCNKTKEKDTTTITVTATAYNSVESQTKKGNIGLAAWGDTLVPGIKTIAVSRDLIPMGLGHNAVVEIDGLEGTFIVKDKMNKRWKKKIDIYMGLDEEAAIEWGKKEVEITFVDNTEETVK